MAGARPTPDVVAILLDSYLHYRRRVEHDIGEYLAHFGGLWEEVHQYAGVSGYDGVTRVIMHLPRDWQMWAWTLSLDFTACYRPYFDLVAGFRGFLSALQHQFTVYRRPPDGPYQFPLRLTTEAGLPPPVQPQLSRPLVATDAPTPPASVLGRRDREDFEAGTSVARYRRALSAPPVPTPLSGKGGPSTAYRGKASIVDASPEREAPRSLPSRPPGPGTSTEELLRIVAELQQPRTSAPRPVAHRDWPVCTGPSSSSAGLAPSDLAKWMEELRRSTDRHCRVMLDLSGRLDDLSGRLDDLGQMVGELLHEAEPQPQPAPEPELEEEDPEEDPEEEPEEEGLFVDMEVDPDSDEDLGGGPDADSDAESCLSTESSLVG